MILEAIFKYIGIFLILVTKTFVSGNTRTEFKNVNQKNGVQSDTVTKLKTRERKILRKLLGTNKHRWLLLVSSMKTKCQEWVILIYLCHVHDITEVLYIMALIYQSCVKTGTDLSAELVVQQDTRVIYETFVSDQSQRTNDRVLINAAAEFDRH